MPVGGWAWVRAEQEQETSGGLGADGPTANADQQAAGHAA